MSDIERTAAEKTTTTIPPNEVSEYLSAPLAANDAPSGFEHRQGCPGGPDKVETYTATRPADPEKVRPATDLRITRCVQCGAHDVREA